MADSDDDGMEKFEITDADLNFELGPNRRGQTKHQATYGMILILKLIELGL